MRATVRSSSSSFRIVVAALLVAVSGQLPAQTAPVGIVYEPSPAASGTVQNSGLDPDTVWSRIFGAAEATSLQVVFDSVNFGGNEDRVVIRSLFDADVQVFHRESFADWQLHSAWFNGSEVQVDFVLGPGSTGSIAIAGLSVDRPAPSVDTLCGVDDRNLHIDLRVGRVVPSANFNCTWPNPCAATAFLIGNLPMILSARHVAVFSFPLPPGMAGPPQPLFRLVEFGICQSTATGAIQHPPAAAQFPIDQTNIVMSAASVQGDDWVLARLLPNAGGSTAIQTQGNGFNLANALPAAGTTLRVPGFGMDNTPLDNNQSRQSATGPYNGNCGNVVHHAVDTENGNSGSPIVNTLTGDVIGIHCFGGCAAPGSSNGGTSILNFNLQAALAAAVQPLWQQNSDRCSLDLDGAPGTGGGGPITVVKAQGEMTTMNLGGTATGHPWDLGIVLNAPPVAANAGGMTLPYGEIVNLPVSHPGLIFLYGLSFSIPYTPLSLPFAAPAFLQEMTAQSFVLDPASPLGIKFGAAVFLRILDDPSVAGPAGDDSVATINLCQAPLNGPLSMPFFGSSYSQIHVVSNGRVMFNAGSTSWTPTAAAALASEPFVGCWMDLNPNAGGSVTITRPQAQVVRVNYTNIPYFGQAGTSSTFRIRLNAGTGLISLENLNGIGAQAAGGTLPMFLGMSRGNTGATNPGVTAFAVGPAQPNPPPNYIVNLPANSTDMIFSLGAAAAPAGLTMLTFVPLPASHAASPNYGWLGQ